MMFHFFIFFFVFAGGDINITGNFSFRHEIHDILEIDLHYGQLFNSLNISKLHEDEFQKININGCISVIYSKNGLLYSTTCKIIDKIYVPSILDTCTLDLPVYYIKDNIRITLFLTKTGLLRNTSTIVGWSQEATVFRADHKSFKVFNRN